MSSGAYIALSGLRTRAEQLDRLASDLANVGTAGYKAERGTTEAARRPSFGAALESAIDVAQGATRLDLRAGALARTGGDLDLAIDGPGFFAIETPDGTRYTRNGHFTRRADGMLATDDGHAVLGENGPLRLDGAGALSVGDDGQVRVGEGAIGRPLIVDLPASASLQREDGARFRLPAGASATPLAGAKLVAGALEQSNVSLVERMAHLTEVSRGFEALQRGVTLMMNDLDGRAITELGRR